MRTGSVKTGNGDPFHKEQAVDTKEELRCIDKIILLGKISEIYRIYEEIIDKHDIILAQAGIYLFLSLQNDVAISKVGV